MHRPVIKCCRTGNNQHLSALKGWRWGLVAKFQPRWAAAAPRRYFVGVRCAGRGISSREIPEHSARRQRRERGERQRSGGAASASVLRRRLLGPERGRCGAGITKPGAGEDERSEAEDLPQLVTQPGSSASEELLPEVDCGHFTRWVGFLFLATQTEQQDFGSEGWFLVSDAKPETLQERV